MSAQLDVLISGTTATSYSIRIGTDLLKELLTMLPKNKRMAVIITDHIVKKHYAISIERSLKQAGYKTLLLSCPAGEQSKNGRTKSRLEEKMLAQGCDRDTLILALGGGVVGDLAGFIAATFMRGIAYIQIPTTLLAMLDSSVGGKTGIDTPQGKNLIGAFWQPSAVIADVNCLRTLSKKQMINGLIEALKMFLISDKDSLTFLEENLAVILSDIPNSSSRTRDDVLINLIHRAVKMKADIVAHDEREQHQRAILNFGHTIGHAIEHLTQYQCLHGYAVALGILVEAKIAQLMGHLHVTHYLYIKTLLQKLDITLHELKCFDVDALIKSTQLDKKKRDGLVRYVLLTGLGTVYEHDGQFVHPVDDVLVKRAFFEIIGA